MQSKVVKNLFDLFNDNDVIYCHWKSTDHLDASFEAKTDLDVLVGKESTRSCEKILLELGFVRMRTPDARTYPCVEDFICFDKDLGRWVHLHLHYQLPCGDRWVKAYRIPIENYILENRVFLDEYNIYNVDPLTEFLFFVTRMHMKWRLPNKKNSVKKENKYLISRIDFSVIDITKHPLYFEEMTELYNCYINNKVPSLSIIQILKFKKHLSKFRRMPLFEFFFKRALRYLYRLNIEFSRRTLGDKSFGRRLCVSGGGVIAFVGMDGSGKSSMIDEVHKVFSKQINVQKVFLGTGRSGAGFLRRIIFKLSDSAIKKKKKDEGSNLIQKAKVKKKPKLLRMFWIYLCLRDRKKELKKLNRAAANGSLVIVDRWPQDQMLNLADAPRLTYFLNKNGLLGRLAKYEYSFYQEIKKAPIDKHIWFDISPEVSLERKPDELSLSQAKEYRSVLKTLVDKEFVNCVVINADEAYEAVRAKACNSVWECFSAQ